jgi:hypothetical protein
MVFGVTCNGLKFGTSFYAKSRWSQLEKLLVLVQETIFLKFGSNVKSKICFQNDVLGPKFLELGLQYNLTPRKCEGFVNKYANNEQLTN